MNRIAAINRLQLGRGLGAEVKAKSIECRAWVHIEPIINPKLGQLVNQSHRQAEATLDRYQVGNSPINEFNARLRELHRDFEKCPDDWDLIGLETDEVTRLDSIESLESHLQTHFALEWTDLQLPHDLDAPF